jgi:hypothetical protein
MGQRARTQQRTHALLLLYSMRLLRSQFAYLLGRASGSTCRQQPTKSLKDREKSPSCFCFVVRGLRCVALRCAALNSARGQPVCALVLTQARVGGWGGGWGGGSVYIFLYLLTSVGGSSFGIRKTAFIGCSWVGCKGMCVFLYTSGFDVFLASVGVIKCTV